MSDEVFDFFENLDIDALVENETQRVMPPQMNYEEPGPHFLVSPLGDILWSYGHIEDDEEVL